jgi:hypothetical protein
MVVTCILKGSHQPDVAEFRMLCALQCPSEHRDYVSPNPRAIANVGINPQLTRTPRQVSLLGQAYAARELLRPIYGQLFHAGSMPSSAASPSIFRRTSVSADLTEFALR